MNNNVKKDANFNKAMNFVFTLEGGYSNHKYDMGGATNYGITQGTYNAYRVKNRLNMQPVKNIKKSEAIDIYYEEYWLKSGADKVDDFSLALLLFDSSVNHGVSAGKKLFEESDGNLDKFLSLRRKKYEKIVAANPYQKVFLKGWMNRINKLENYIKTC